MAKKLTHEEFLEKFYIKNKKAKNIEILEKYTNSSTPIKCRCKIDGYEWYPIPNNLINNNSGCPKCSGKMQKTHEEFIKEMKEINTDIEFLNEYESVFTKIRCRCRIDGYEWEVTPHDLLNKKVGCPKCARKSQVEKQSKTHEEFIKEMKEINDDIEILGEYKGNKTKIKCRCKIDGNIWHTKPNNLLANNSGCPKCNASKGEKRIAEYLNNRNIKHKEQYRFNDCKFKYTLPFDFYIPSLNLCIEYDGVDHFEINIRSNKQTYEQAMEKFIERKIRDTVKNIYCKENNIKLIRIPYWDFDRIEEILDEKLED